MITPHPEEAKVNAMLYREDSYPEHFTINDQLNERLERVRLGLVHVLTELLPKEGSCEAIHCWLFGMLSLVEISLIDKNKSSSKCLTTRDNSLNNIIHDARIASNYTGQLLELWDQNLDSRLHAANPAAAARFRTLITEINATARRIDHRVEGLEAGK